MKRYIEIVHTHSDFNGRWLRCYSLFRCDLQLHIAIPERHSDVTISKTVYAMKLKFWKNITQPPIQWVPGTLSPGVKRPGREVDHSPPTSAEVKKTWVNTSTSTYIFMR
jgi:hypothetical protein